MSALPPPRSGRGSLQRKHTNNRLISAGLWLQEITHTAGHSAARPGEAWVMNGAAGSEPDKPADQEAQNRTGHLKVETPHHRPKKANLKSLTQGSSLKGISKC